MAIPHKLYLRLFVQKDKRKWQPSQTAIFLALNLSEAVELSGSSLAQPELQEKKQEAEECDEDSQHRT